MSRIRSVHPGLFTDEAFVQLSAPAQVFWIGLWCEADDQGVFEWKPITLKMRVMPASTAAVEPLLDELTAIGCIRSFEVDGRRYGIVRNFAKHQRPKSPKDVHPLPEELRNYAGFNSDGTRPDATTGRKRFASGSEQVRKEFGTGSESGSQMEDGGGRREEKGKGEPTKTVQDDDPASGADGADRHPEGKYEFVSGVIRLNRRDFEEWQRDYPHLNLRAELRSLAQWAAEQGKWWMPVQAALAKRDREARLAVERIKADAVAAAGRPKPVARAYVC